MNYNCQGLEIEVKKPLGHIIFAVFQKMENFVLLYLSKTRWLKPGHLSVKMIYQFAYNKILCYLWRLKLHYFVYELFYES